MNKTLIAELITKGAKQRVKISFFFLVISFLFLITSVEDVFNVFFYIPEIDNIKETVSSYKEHKRHIYFMPKEIIETGHLVSRIEEKSKKVVDLYYYAILPGEDGLILARVTKDDLEKSGQQGIKLQGTLRELLPGSNEKKVIDEIMPKDSTEEQQKDFLSHFPSIYFDAYSSGLVFDRVKITAFVAVFLVALIFLLDAYRSFKDYRTHKSYKALAKYGDPEQVEMNIEKERNDTSENAVLNFESCYFLKTYFVGLKGYSVDVLPVNDLLWVYKSIFRKKTMFITVYKIVSVVLNFKGKRSFKMDVKNEEIADQVIADISARIKVVAGYSEDLSKLYENDEDGFTQLIL